MRKKINVELMRWRGIVADDVYDRTFFFSGSACRSTSRVTGAVSPVQKAT